MGRPLDAWDMWTVEELEEQEAQIADAIDGGQCTKGNRLDILLEDVKTELERRRTGGAARMEKTSDIVSFTVGLRMAFDATIAALDADAAGRYTEPMPTDVRTMLERHSCELAKAAVDAGILEEGA